MRARARRGLAAAAAGAALAGVAWADYLTGPLLGLTPFYLLVVIGVALHASWVVGTLFSAAAAGMLLAVDVLGAGGELTCAAAWRAGAHLLGFAVVAVVIARLAEDHRHLRQTHQAVAEQRDELDLLNARLLQSVHDAAGERQRAVEQLAERHLAELRELRTLLAQLAGRGPAAAPGERVT